MEKVGSACPTDVRYSGQFITSGQHGLLRCYHSNTKYCVIIASIVQCRYYRRHVQISDMEPLFMLGAQSSKCSTAMCDLAPVLITTSCPKNPKMPQKSININTNKYQSTNLPCMIRHLLCTTVHTRTAVEYTGSSYDSLDNRGEIDREDLHKAQIYRGCQQHCRTIAASVIKITVIAVYCCIHTFTHSADLSYSGAKWCEAQQSLLCVLCPRISSPRHGETRLPDP